MLVIFPKMHPKPMENMAAKRKASYSMALSELDLAFSINSPMLITVCASECYGQLGGSSDVVM